MNPERLAEIKARAEATSIPWRVVVTEINDHGDDELPTWVAAQGPLHRLDDHGDGDEEQYAKAKNDSLFCQKAREDIVDLVAEVERLRCAIDELDDAKDTVAHYSWCSDVIKAVRTWPKGQYGMRLKR